MGIRGTIFQEVLTAAVSRQEGQVPRFHSDWKFGELTEFKRNFLQVSTRTTQQVWETKQARFLVLLAASVFHTRRSGRD